MKNLTLIFLLLTIAERCPKASSEIIKNNNTFLATNEWQVIPEGQGIPPGLHVRIDLTTGKKEAKILDESEQKESKDSDSALSTVPENDSKTPVKGTAKHNLKISKTVDTLNRIHIKESLTLGFSPKEFEKMKKRSYKQLKDSYEDLRKNFKTDAEVILELIDEYRNLTKSDQEPQLKAQTKITKQMHTLDNFNNLVHQFDNALIFIDGGGLDVVLLPLVVNETHVGLRVQAMRVLGALTQNNPKAQIKVFERNFGSYLSQILISSTNTEELSTALYAIGALLRKFPHAQQRILSTSGTQALIAVLSKDCELKIKARAATLISDVIVEKRFVLSTSSGEYDPLAAAQYAELNFDEWLKTTAFCETFDSLVSSKLYEFLEQPDVMEYFVYALENTQHICSALWSQSPQLRHTLLTIKNRFLHSQDEYRIEVAQQIIRLLTLLYSDYLPRDEL